MSSKLKIYACSGISETAQQPVQYWTDGTNTLSNTQAVNTLLARINLLHIEATRLSGISQQEKIDKYNEIDVLTVCLEAARRFSDNSEQLYHAGEVISAMWKQGAFNFDSTDSRKREDRLEELIAKGNEAYDDTMPVTDTDEEFLMWWHKTVMERNITGLNFGQQQNARKALKKGIEAIKGIGAVDWKKYSDGKWLENADLAQLLTAGADYFIYTYFTDEQLAKLPAVFKLKHKYQMKTYNYCKQCFVDIYGSEEDMQRIIVAGIIDELEQYPEDYCAGIVEEFNKNKSISGFTIFGLVGAEAVKALIELLTVITTLLVGVISAVCSMVASTNVAKYGAIDREAIKSGVPDASDYDGLDLDGLSTGGDKTSWLPLAAIGLGLLFLLKK